MGATRNVGIDVLSECVFCGLDSSRIVQQSGLMIVIRDAFPVTPLHTLVIPKRHVGSYFELTDDELYQLRRLLSDQRREIREADNTVSGFNIGVNDGESAGQTVFHCHVHLIPRRRGDVENPQGGVRGVIPSKQGYR